MTRARVARRRLAGFWPRGLALLVLTALSGCRGVDVPRVVDVANEEPATHETFVAPERDRAFYAKLALDPTHLPEGTNALELTLDLQRWIGDPDPQRRDEFAYGLPAVWIRRGLVPEAELAKLVDRWRANLQVGVGETSGRGVLARSFSALALDSALSLETRRPFLGERAVQAVCLDLVRYLERERDLRDWDPTLGWIHATAHTADALARCVRHPAIDDAMRRRIVDAIEAKLAVVDHVFTFGENRRLALVLAAIVERDEGDVTPITTWRAALSEREARLWSVPKLDPKLFARVENETQVFESLLAAIAPLPPDHPRAALVRAACVTK